MGYEDFGAEEEGMNQRVYENLLYCINGKPRLFRWRKGFIEWAPITRPWQWRVLPGQDGE